MTPCLSHRPHGRWLLPVRRCGVLALLTTALVAVAGPASHGQEKADPPQEGEKREEGRRPNILTLDDLRRALTGGEATQSQSVSEGGGAEASPEAPETTPGTEGTKKGQTPPNPAPSTQDRPSGPDLKAGDTDSPSSSAPDAADPGEPERNLSADDAPDNANETAASTRAPSSRQATPESDPSKWVCKISAATDRPEGNLDRSTDTAFSVYFSTGDFALNRSGLLALTQNTPKINGIVGSGGQLAVVGNTDDVGDPTANIILSLQRAYNVKACIMKLIGVAEANVTVFGFGPFSPILEAPDRTASGNRRVDVLPLSEYKSRFENAFSELNQ